MSKATPNVYINNIFGEDDGEDYEDCFSPEEQSDYEDVNPIPKSSPFKLNPIPKSSPLKLNPISKSSPLKLNPIPKSSPLKTNVNISHNITNNQSLQDNPRSQKKQVPWRLLLFITSSVLLITIIVSNVVTFVTTKNKFLEKKTRHLLCSSLPCLNGGLCVNVEGLYYCSCTRGFSGKNCEVTPCTGFNCLNGGACEVLNGTFHCLCKSGFTGMFCEEPKPCVSNPCFHAASCTGSDNNYICHCPIGTEGNRCQEEINAVITSQNYPLPYTDNIYKIWNIDVGNGNTAKIKFTAFELENGSDFVKIYNGHSTGCCSLANYTGYTLPSERTSTGRYMTIVFKTDHSVQKSGFRALIYNITSN
ncbi:protein eyes shut-like isoform X2 [Mytilus trossulus]|uniref:protein eyes shut-like isoform X2 n=1 Tax=Mytilus trossulus TaxID=6551 RepID=UPI003005BDA3